MAFVPPAAPPSRRRGMEAAGYAWLRRAEEVIAGSTDALNAINVFPVPDADTGSNLKMTLRGLAGAGNADRADGSDASARLDAVVQRAILSAHGNSGAILAEMITSACRWLQHCGDELPRSPSGSLLASLLQTVAAAATRAVATPIAGTILTVAQAAAHAAEAAAAAKPADPLAVAEEARAAAARALSRTPYQLEVLHHAGVVDAGGQAYVLLLDCLVEVLGGTRAQPLLATTASPTGEPPSRSSPPPGFEVMYVLRRASPASLDQLRSNLSDIGHSVVIVGDESVAQVHVHLALPGPAVEAGYGLGELSQLKVTDLAEGHAVAVAERTVVSMVAGPGITQAVKNLGGVAMQSESPAVLGKLQDLLGRTCGDLILLPNDPERLEAARQLVTTGDRRVTVIPTVAQVQGLAAIAVHEPTADFDAAVTAMTTAAEQTRNGAVTLAREAAATGAGACQVGDVLGLVGGEVIEIGSSVLEVAWRVVERLLHPEAELLTLVAGQGCENVLVDELERRTRAATGVVDVERIVGGQQHDLLLVGVE